MTETASDMRARAILERNSKSRTTVVIASPGGAFAGGGMGTVSRLIAESLNASDTGYAALIIDPRGSGTALAWPLHFARASLRLAVVSFAQRALILHLQVSERSSFIRKGMLLFFARLRRLPVVLHHHGAELIPTYRGGSGPMRALMRWTVRSATINIVLGDVWRRFLVDELGADPSAVVVLRNASADLGALASSPAEPAAREPRLVMLANLSPRKGVGELLQAIALLKRRGVRVPTTIAGGGEVERYKQEAAERGIADLCHFTGWVGRPEVEALLTSATALVLPSYEEGLPMAILEALSARIPVIATPVGSIPEVLTDGETCLLVQPGQPQDLAAGIESIIRDEALRARLVAHGRALYDREFDAGRYVAKLTAIYGKLGTTA